MSDTYYDPATGTWKKYTGRMAYRPYREAILSGEFVPSAYALEVDKILDEIKEIGPPPAGNPDHWTWVGSMGWVLTHPLAPYNSLTEHTSWVNAGLGDNFFGAGSTSSEYDPAGTNVNGTGQGISNDNAAAAVVNPNYTEEQLRDLYVRYLGRQPGEAGLSYWMARAGTMTYEELVEAIKNSPEGVTYAESQANQNQTGVITDVITTLFTNTFGRAPTQDEIAQYVGMYTGDIDAIQAAMTQAAQTNNGATEASGGIQAGADLEAYRSVVNGLYNELFGRDALQQGMDYWLAQLRSGAVTPDNLRNALIAAAQGSDLEYYQNNVLNGGTNTNTNTGGGGATTNGGGTTTSGNGTTTTSNGGTNTNGGSTDPVVQGWYWSGTAWLPYYTGEAPPANAPTVAGQVIPNFTPATTSDETQESEPPPPELFTPDASMFYQGMFTAGDLLNRDGGDISSTFYSNARQDVLNSLAAQASAAGRTQNTAQEIAMAQGMTMPTFSAGGLFNPNNQALLRSMGL